MPAREQPPDSFTDDGGVTRCWWCGTDAEYQRYHDEEWGVPVTEDRRLFEKICLEGFQCGLSWITILKRRENFRRCFAGFDWVRVAEMTASDVGRLLDDPGIIRHRGKIEATIHNANRMMDLVDSGTTLSEFLWQFQPKKQTVYRRRDQVPAITDESTRMSKALKKLGWKFVGPTTCYALMQAMGMVNDHLVGCDWHDR